MEFKLSNLMHSALVSITGDSDEMFIHVQLINSFFKKIFGVEHIRFCAYKDKVVIRDIKHPFAYELARAVSSIVRKQVIEPVTNPLRAV